MRDPYSAPDYQYIAFIDEAGDPGIRKVFPVDPDGASEWLCLAAVVIDKSRENETVDWVRDIRRALRASQGPALHYRGLLPHKKQEVCTHFAGRELRGFVLLSNKKNMRGYRNTRAEKVPSQQWFYNWCARLLLERVTDWCERRSLKYFKEPRLVKFVFSQRGGMAYSQTKAYHYLLRQQARSGTTFVKAREIKWAVMDWRLVEAHPHQQIAGLQIADVFASAFYQAADALGPTNWDTAPAKLLKPRIATNKGIIADYGVTLWPTPPYRAELTPEQRQIFEFYGYSSF